jgi:FkbM family methyltransferase
VSHTHLVESLVLQDGEQEISASGYTLGLGEAEEFLIYIDREERDGISTAIAGGTYSLPSEYDVLPELIAPGQKVLDLGAHIGTFSLFAAALGCQVVSVEASPRNAALLRHSAHVNGFVAQRVVSAAVSDHVGRLEFVQAGSYGMVANPKVGHPTISVSAVTVDKLLHDVGWESVDFVKMDVEGSEVAALRGMSRLLSREDAPPILYESNAYTLNLFKETPARLMALLEEYGYRCYLVDVNRLVRVRADELQIEVYADYLATKHPLEALGAWPIVPSLSFEDRIVKILSSSVDPSVHARAYFARALSRADVRTLSDPRVVNALAVLETDRDASVRTAVAWSRGTEMERAQPDVFRQVDGESNAKVVLRAWAHRRHRIVLEWDRLSAEVSRWKDPPLRGVIELCRRFVRAVWTKLKRWVKRV